MIIEIGGIFLAAGSASRFGDQKLLCKLPDGAPMVISAAKVFKASIAHPIAIVNNLSSEVAVCLAQEGFGLVDNPNCESGIGTSIARGIQYFEAADAWVIALGDMPYIHTSTIDKIKKYLNTGNKIVAPCYQGKRGHPVGFASDYKNELLALHSDVGAKDIIKKHKNEVKYVDVDDEGILIDIDTKQQLDEEFKRSFK